MSTYNITISEVTGTAVVIKVGFGSPAQNDQIVKDAAEAIKAIGDTPNGKVVKVNGPASLPVAMVLAHHFAHVAKAVACFDPKLAKYVVAISHDPALAVGDLID